MHIHVMMDDVYIYHTHNFFGLFLFCVGTHGLACPPLPSHKDFTHLFYMALTWLWVIVHYILYAHLAMFTLHDILIHMPLPCICDPCFALHMMIDSTTSMCICKLGGAIDCYCHVC